MKPQTLSWAKGTRREFIRRAGTVVGLGAFALASRRASAADIVTSQDKAITLSSEEYLRQFNVPASWSTLRLAVLISSNLGADYADGHFAVGLCNGTSQGYAHASPIHFVGMNLTKTAPKTAGIIDYNSATVPVHLPSITTTTPGIGKVVDGSVTGGSNGAENSTNWYICGNGSTYRFPFAIDFIKGSPWIIKAWGSPGNDTSPASFATNMLLPTPKDGVSIALTYLSNELAVDEATDGALNAVNIYFSPATALLRIHEIRVIQMA